MAHPLDEPADVNWWDRVPPVLCPIPIADWTPESGSAIDRRVIIGDRASGTWLYDQRAVTKVHTREEKLVIGVISESDWYRRKRDPAHPAIPNPVDVDRVFIELFETSGRGGAPEPMDQSDLLPGDRSVSMSVHPEVPPVRWPRRADRERFITGARCWLITRRGPVSGYRIAGEPRRATSTSLNLSAGIDGLDTPPTVAMAPVLREADWYGWLDAGEQPTAHVQVQLIYLE